MTGTAAVDGTERSSALAAELPLPGGRPDATLTLHPLLCAEVAMPEAWVHRESGLGGALRAFGLGPGGPPPLRAPIVAFLLEHPVAGLILVDTGFHPDVMTAKSRELGAVNSRVFRGVRMRPENAVGAQLSARGIAPEDIALIVMTHLHVDHAGALRDFPGATVLVTDAEWDAVHIRGAALSGYHGAQLDPRLEYRLVSPPTPPAAGLERLDQAVDVFGDGSLRLLFTPGHTAGHQSLLVRLSDREALLAGDAIYTLANLREGKRPYRMVDRDAYEASVQVLAAYDRAHPDALVVPGHDMAAWSELEPEYS
ncbi:MAG: N-acyl homoserine lactone hydrolase [Solirubrobacteraceae bacterium]|jgi:glyoxylase-like metal-dependent hydrolase (beta-lactamase superfamily II)|nr:N-acyl homoserine lactone hydrolase [Solirubrobacteraceae bacterium]